MKQCISAFFKNRKGKSWSLLVLAFSFMLCVFAPLERYFTNKSEFWFESIHIFLVTMVVFLISTILLLIIVYFLSKTKVGTILFDIMFCFMIYVYIQGNYIPRDYGILNGAQIDWGSYTGYAITSIVLLIITVIGIVVMYKIVKQKVFNISNFVCMILILLQVTTLGILFIQKIDNMDTDTKVVVTKNSMFELSADKNVVVFVFDAFDSHYMRELLSGDEKEKYTSLLENYTYYPDTVGAYSTTKGSLPFILTGKWYENDMKYGEYVQKAYEDNEIYKALQANGYSIGVYTTPQYVSNEYDMYTNIEEGEYSVSNYVNFTKKIYQLVAFNYMPHQLKRYFLIDTAEFDELKTLNQIGEAFSWEQINFYNSFKKNGISVADNQKSFRFYHISGTHAPFTFNESLIENEKNTYNALDEAKGCIELLKQYEEELKREGIYDDTTIIVMADHGDTYVWSDNKQNPLNQNPVFLIKNASENHKFKISDVPMSYEYLDDVFISLVNGEQITESYISECFSKMKYRRFLRYTWDSSWEQDYLPYILEYYTYGSAEKLENFVRSGREFAPGTATKIYLYSLGSEITFGIDGNAKDFSILNIGGLDNWTSDDYAIMKFKIEEDYDNLLLSMNFGTAQEAEHVNIYANGNLVAELITSGETDKKIVIPKEYVPNGDLTLFMELPDAKQPTNGDLRKVALWMRKMTIISTTDEIDEKNQFTGRYELGDKLSFRSEEKSGNMYAISGISSAEPSLSWTYDNSAELFFKIKENIQEDLILSMDYSIAGEFQTVIVSANGHQLEKYIAKGRENKYIVIPKEYIENNELLIHIDLPDAKAPSNGDKRKLGLALRSMELFAISSLEEIGEEVLNKYSLGTELIFKGESANGNQYVSKGVSSAEPTGSWTNAKEAVFQFYIEDYEMKSDLKLLLKYVIAGESQRIKILANGNEVVDYVAMEAETKEITIPVEYLNGNGKLQLILELPDAAKPSNGDKRELALFLKSLVLE